MAPKTIFKTRITEILGIEYPIICGGMNLISRAELVAAVSNAGGLGILISTIFQSKKQLRGEIKNTKVLTDKPIGVNINVSPRRLHLGIPCLKPKDVIRYCSKKG
jgi:NAD(P)H-dependent flavin oxidoreductase YrpB (nitropropane dioxygenase family)